MRKTNIIKTVFAGIFFTMVAGTAVFANSHSEKVVITGNNEYYGQYEGIEGHYSVTGTQTYTTLRIVNITNGIRLFDGYPSQYETELTETYSYTVQQR